jgi:hypothetical protein
MTHQIPLVIGVTGHCNLHPEEIYWLRIGKLAEDNPDLPLSFLKDIWQALQETESEEYVYEGF